MFRERARFSVSEAIDKGKELRLMGLNANWRRDERSARRWIWSRSKGCSSRGKGLDRCERRGDGRGARRGASAIVDDYNVQLQLQLPPQLRRQLPLLNAGDDRGAEGREDCLARKASGATSRMPLSSGLGCPDGAIVLRARASARAASPPKDPGRCAPTRDRCDVRCGLCASASSALSCLVACYSCWPLACDAF